MRRGRRAQIVGSVSALLVVLAALAYVLHEEDASRAPVFVVPALGQQLAPRPALDGPGAAPRATDLAVPGAPRRVQDEPAGISLRGRVVDGFGGPVAGARVTALSSLAARRTPASGVPLPSDDLLHGHSAADGAFELVLEARQVDSRTAPQVVVRHPGWTTRIVICDGLTADGQDLGDLVLWPAGQLTGRVVDPVGRPVEGALVQLTSWQNPPGSRIPVDAPALSLAIETRSDAQGRFQLDGLSPGSGRASISRPGFARVSTGRFDVPAGRAHGLGEIVLGVGRQVSGVVLDPAGQPVADAEVWVVDWPLADAGRRDDLPASVHKLRRFEGPGLRTGADGRFAVAGLGDGALHVLAVAVGREPVRRDDVDPDRAHELVLFPEARLDVRVLDDATGAPARASEITALRMAGSDDPRDDTPLETRLTDDAAVHRVHGAGPVGTRVLAAGAGLETRVVELPGLATGASARHDVRLAPEAVLAGRVLDGEGRGCAGVLLSLVQLGRDVTRPREHQAWTDTAGRFALGNLRGGRWELHASSPAHLPLEPLLVELDTAERREDLVLTLRDAGSVGGLVLDAAGDPAPHVVVQASRAGDPDARLWQTRSDARGRYRLLALPPGLYDLRAHPGATGRAQVEVETAVEVDLLLRRLARVHGRVEPAATAAWVVVEEPDGGRAALLPVAADGSYAGQLPPGPYALRALAHGGGLGPVVEVSLGWEGDVLRDLQLGAATLVGRCVDAGGLGVEDVLVQLHGAAGPVSDAVLSDALGEFRRSGLMAGAYELRLTRDDLLPVTVQVELGAGELHDVGALRVRPGLTLSGQVRDARGAAVADGTVVLVLRDDALVSASTTRAGRYDVHGLQPGTYALEVLSGGDGVASHREMIVLTAEPELQNADVIIDART